jgi:uncharacterized Zn finger protein
MPECPTCARHLVRIHRARLERIWYVAVFRCPSCGFRVGSFHPFLFVNYSFIFSRHTRCIRCGSVYVHRALKRDPIEATSKHVFSWFWRTLGAPLNKCPGCRLQYYDWRPPHPGSPSLSFSNKKQSPECSKTGQMMNSLTTLIRVS